MAHYPRPPHQGQPSPALSQPDSSTHTAKITSPRLQGQRRLRSSCINESRFTPVRVPSTEPYDTEPSHATVLPSPTPSGEANSPIAMLGQPGPTVSNEALATEAGSSGTAGSPPGPLASPWTQLAAPAEAHQPAGTSMPENANAAQQEAVSRTRCEGWLAELQSYISQREGSLQHLENFRLQCLKSVLSVGDEFSVVVHGFLILWILDAQRCAELLGLPRAVVDSACKTLDSVFGGTRAMSNEVLAWMVNFPPGLRSGGLCSTSVMNVSKFFQRLAVNWKDLLRDHLHGLQIPLRHRELVGVLQLRSQHLRLTFFRWSLTFLKVHGPSNSNVIAALEKNFAEDQDFYLDRSRSKEEYTLHDAKVASAFEALMGAAKRGEPDEVAPQAGPVMASPSQAQQQPRDQPQEQPRKRRRTESVEERLPLVEHAQRLQQTQQQQQQQQQIEHYWRLQQQRFSHIQQQAYPQGCPEPQGHPQQQGYPQPQGYLQTHSQGLAHLQRLAMGPTAVQQQSSVGRMQLGQYDLNLLRQQLQAQAHQQGHSQQSDPTYSGTWSFSAADGLSAPVGGQTGRPQVAVAISGNGRRSQAQGQAPLTSTIGPGGAPHQGAPMPPQMSHYGQGIPQPRSNLGSPTVASPASRRPSMDQQPWTSTPQYPTQGYSGPAITQLFAQEHHLNHRFAAQSPIAMTTQNINPGPAPGPSTLNPPLSSQAPVALGPFHQYIGSLLACPKHLPTNAKRVRFEFDLSASDLKLLPQFSTGGDGKSRCNIFEGCRRVRFRICVTRIPESTENLAFPENEWADAPTFWPASLTVKVNEDGYVTVPKRRGSSSDMPCEITVMLRQGRNSVSVAVVSDAPPSYAFFGAIEVLDTATQKSVVDNTLRERSLPETETIGIIKTRLTASEDDDDVQVVDPEMYISLADPISGGLVELPCRGDTCRHLDVFDLRALLESRHPKRCPHDRNRASCGVCLMSPTAWPDVTPIHGWMCPICSGDARPNHIVVDKFLQGVVKKLRERGEEPERVTAIYVDREGRWRAKEKEKKWEREVVVIDG